MTQTGPLIDSLTRDLCPVRPRRAWREALIVSVLFLVELAMLIWAGRMRHDMPHAMDMPSFWWKLAGLSVIVIASTATAILSLDPSRSPRRGLRIVAVTILAVLAAGWVVDAVQAAIVNGAPGLGQRLAWHSGLRCALGIVELSLPAAIALGILMRRGAAVDRGGTAWAAGIAASTWGALAFAFVCPFDDPLYLAVWFVGGCGTVAVLSRLILPRLMRW